MGILRINIDQQFAQIGVKTTPAKLNIKMPKGQLNIQDQRPRPQIDSQMPTFKVNRQKINSEMGLKSSGEFARDFSAQGRQGALRGAAMAKNDGNFVANPGLPGAKAFPALAKNKAMANLAPPETNIGLMPKSSPEIQWDKGYMRINWSDSSVIIDYSGDYEPDISVDPRTTVEVFLRTKPYLRVMVEEAVPGGALIDRAI